MIILFLSNVYIGVFSYAQKLLLRKIIKFLRNKSAS